MGRYLKSVVINFKWHIKIMIEKIVGYIFKGISINNDKVVFVNMGGEGYGDNPKFIADALINEKQELDLVWLSKNVNDIFPKEIRVVKYGTLKSLYELATSKVWVVNIRNFFRVRKKAGQYIIQTWHAGIGLKRAEGAAIDKLSDNYIKEAKLDGKEADLFLSNSKWLTEQYRKDFWYSGEILEKGLPREDFLFGDKDIMHKKVAEFYGTDEETHFFLYAPTFRADKNFDVYFQNYEELLDKIQKTYGDNYKIIVRFHHNCKEFQKKIAFNNMILDGTIYPDMNELIIACDWLMTDYSSCMFDAMLAGKRVILYASDIEKFESERGFLFQLSELPFPLCNTELQLYDCIVCKEDKLRQERAEFCKKLGFFEGGHASEEVAKRILSVINDEF